MSRSDERQGASEAEFKAVLLIGFAMALTIGAGAAGFWITREDVAAGLWVVAVSVLGGLAFCFYALSRAMDLD